MNKELAASIKKLNKENRRILLKMEHYMETRSINEIACEEILSDIVGMALEYQERGEPFSSAIGSDYESFCRELVRNSPRQSIFERILILLRWLFLYGMLILPVLYLVERIVPGFTPAEIRGGIYSVPAVFLTKYFTLLIILVVGWFFVKMYTYKPMKYVIGTYITVFMLFFLFSNELLTLILGDLPVTVNIFWWVLGLGGATLLCDLARRLAAMTVAYQKKKSEKKEESEKP